MADDPMAKLSAVLDIIDASANKAESKRRLSETEPSPDEHDKSKLLGLHDSDKASATCWYRYFDMGQQLYYYYNTQTQATQWDEPASPYIDMTLPVSVQGRKLSSDHTASDHTASYHAASDHTASDHTASDHTTSDHTASDHTASDHTASDHTASDQYRSVATFKRSTGSFSLSGTRTYWDSVGRPNDKEGRQMAAYFDMSQLDGNREEAVRKKQKLESKIDWKKYRVEKRRDSVIKKTSWLKND
jgi:hypothetical protein